MKNKKYLTKKIVPFDAKKVSDVTSLLNSLKGCGFQGKNLGIAMDVLYKMVSDKDTTVVLTLSGAMVPAGFGKLIYDLIDNDIIDVLVSTGANIIHDLVDSFADIGHYSGSTAVDDDELFDNRINRIYDVFLPEESYQLTQNKLKKIVDTKFPDKITDMKTSDFLRELGSALEKDCILKIAAEKNVPVFIPAFSDSELAMNLLSYAIKDGREFKFDILGDISKFGDIIKGSKKNGTIVVGGGVPRNWAQQIYPFLDQSYNIDSMGYDYSVRIHTAVEHDGGLSGSTVSEGKTWGKYTQESTHASVWCDASIALPLLISGLFQKLNIKQ